MRNFITTLIFALMVCPIIRQTDSTNEELDRDESLLRQAFERPLQIELQIRGLTPRNAAVASQYVLNELFECWKSERNAPTGTEEKMIFVRLGGKTIVTYETPCMDEFFKLIGNLAG